MLGVGMLMALAWSSVSQFLIPLRGTREFGLGRGGVSILMALAQIVDLIVLLPVGRLQVRRAMVSFHRVCGITPAVSFVPRVPFKSPAMLL